MFWNSWASTRNGLKLIVCGCATTWMTNKLLADKGGLHNRVTRPIRLAPFCLRETEDYLQSVGIEWERQEILDAYMILGGERRNLFRDVTGTNKSIRLTLVSAGGIKQNKYSSSIQGKVILDDLFKE